VATTVLGERLAVTVEVDGEGDIVHTSSEMRRFKLRREWVPTPWGGRFGDYRRVLAVDPDRLALDPVSALDQAMSARAAVDENAIPTRPDTWYSEGERLLPVIAELPRYAAE
jgi:hypothetical protein